MDHWTNGECVLVELCVDDRLAVHQALKEGFSDYHSVEQYMSQVVTAVSVCYDTSLCTDGS